MNRKVLAVMLGLIASAADASCYTVYDRSDRMIFRSTATPVDLSQPLKEQVQRRWPGGSLIFSPDSGSCYEVVDLPQIRTSASALNVREVLEDMEQRGAGESATGTGAYGNSGGGASGKDVNVRSYTRRDGTVVQAYTRSAPSGRSGGRGR